MGQNIKTKIVTKLICFIRFNGDKTHKFKMWQNFKDQNVTKKIYIYKKIKIITWQNSKHSKCDKTQKLKKWLN